MFLFTWSELATQEYRRNQSANPDGSFFVLRTDVVDDSIIQFDQTIHWLDPNGAQLGIARFPLAESY